MPWEWGYANPIVAAKDGTLLIYSADTNYVFVRVQNGEATILEDAAPDFYLSEGDEPVDGEHGGM